MAQCAFETDFVVTLEGFERQDPYYGTPMSTWNFNYRIESLGLNIVGTNVRNCDPDTSPESCYGAAFVPYSLEHNGEVEVRNREFEVESFYLPDGRIEHAKAVAAEIVLTNPPTSSHQGIIGPYLKTELRGRPVPGNYTLRIWQVPEIDWSKVEDIQVLLDYRYWTRME